MHFIGALYSENVCYIRVHGHDFEGFRLEGGVKQGCPLSPLLFATCVDILLRMLSKAVPDSTTRAFADDIAMRKMLLCYYYEIACRQANN